MTEFIARVIAFAIGMIAGLLIREFLWRLALNACAEIDEPEDWDD